MLLIQAAEIVAQLIAAHAVSFCRHNHKWPAGLAQPLDHLLVVFLRRNVAVHEHDAELQRLALRKIGFDEGGPLSHKFAWEFGVAVAGRSAKTTSARGWP